MTKFWIFMLIFIYVLKISFRIKYSCMRIVLQLYYFILIGILSTSVYRYVILYFYFQEVKRTEQASLMKIMKIC